MILKKMNRYILIEIITIIIAAFIISIFYGCSAHTSLTPIPKGLFEQKTIFEKPFIAKSVEDINKNYYDLYKAYKNNLLLLEYLEKLNNVSKE